MIRQSISFTVSQHKELEAQAKRDDSSIGEVIRQLVDAWVSRKENAADMLCKMRNNY